MFRTWRLFSLSCSSKMLGEYLGVEKDQNQPGGWEIARSRPVDISCGGVTKIDGKNDDYMNSI